MMEIVRKIEISLFIILLFVIGLWFFSPEPLIIKKKNYKYEIYANKTVYYTNEYTLENNCVKFRNKVICGNYQIEDLQ